MNWFESSWWASQWWGASWLSGPAEAPPPAPTGHWWRTNWWAQNWNAANWLHGPASTAEGSARWWANFWWTANWSAQNWFAGPNEEEPPPPAPESGGSIQIIGIEPPRRPTVVHVRGRLALAPLAFRAVPSVTEPAVHSPAGAAVLEDVALAAEPTRVRPIAGEARAGALEARGVARVDREDRDLAILLGFEEIDDFE